METVKKPLYFTSLYLEWTGILIQHNLIDEYHLFVNPVALGSRMPIFKNLESRLTLNLVKSQSFNCGITLLCYEPKRD